MPRSSATIVVLDDSEADRHLIRQALMPAAPRRPLVDFGDPEAALEFLRRQPNAFGGTLLLDWRLDRRCGSEVIAAVRATPQLAAAEVIVLSGMDSAQERERALAAGADDWVRKPMGWDEWEELARGIVTGIRMERNRCGNGEGVKPGLGLNGGAVCLTSLQPMMTQMPHLPLATSPHLAIARMEEAAAQTGAIGPILREFVGFVVGAATQLVDREDVEIKQVCERHRVRVGLVKSGIRDQVIEAKRSAVLRDLISMGWDDPTLMEHFCVSKATLERRRAEVRAGKGVASARN